MSQLDIPKQLNPLYNRPQTVAKHQPLDNPTAYNQWRQRQSEHCWICPDFDRCSPTHKCRHQVDIGVQAQLPTK